MSGATPSRFGSGVKVYWDLARPFTLLMPAVGMTAGGLIAWGAAPRFTSDWTGGASGVAARIVTGAIMAAVMNAGSNGLNQIYDLDIDRINKPLRPLPAGRLRVDEAWRFTLLMLAAGLGLAGLVGVQCLVMAASAALLTAGYSMPPLRTKRHWLAAALTIAIPRGTLLLVAGWSAVKSIARAEPWLLGSVLGLFFLGATTTKDFSDVEGDRAEGCVTLPVRYGIQQAARLIAPFFILPFPIWGILAHAGVLSGNRVVLDGLSALLPLMGAAIALRIVRHPEELGQGENHLSWKLIYLMAVLAYAGLALAYLLPS
jgi:4-hydroxybenzoate polyprenyltransferase